MNLRDAAKQALEALEYGQHSLKQVGEHEWVSRGQLAMQALRAVLAQEQAEPVKPYCYIYEYDQGFGLHREFHPIPYNGMKPSRTVPVYAAPPKQEQAEPVLFIEQAHGIGEE